jgi:uncharacterized membrane protein YqgA involved in biofilm formation
MSAVLINTLTVIIGSVIGMFLKKGIPEKYTGATMTAIGLFSMVIGFQGAFESQNLLVLLISTILGVLTGTLLNIDGALNRLGQRVEERFSKNGDGLVAKGFVTATLLFCVGSMTVVGSLQAGTTGDTTMLITKSMMDLFSSLMLAVTLGLGVLLAAGSVFVIQGALVLLSSVLAPLLSDMMIAEMTAAGSLMFIGIGLNLTGITKLKVADYLPAILYAPFIGLLFQALGIG